MIPWFGVMAMRKSIQSCLLMAIIFLALGSRAFATCSMTGFSLNFSSINVLPGTSIPITGSVNVSCTALTAGPNINVGVSCGAGANCSGNVRTMVSGSNQLQVEFYSDPSYTQVWQAGSIAPPAGS